MTWHDYFTFLVALLLVALLLRIARNLWRGRARFGGQTWRRDTDPFEYWLEIGYDAFSAILLGASIAVPSERTLLLLLSAFAPSLVREYRARKSRAAPSGPPVPRGEILLLVLLYAALIAAALLLIWWTVRPF